jgi:hypothetical protein
MQVNGVVVLTPCVRCGKLIDALLHEDDADFGYCHECFDDVMAERDETTKQQTA